MTPAWLPYFDWPMALWLAPVLAAAVALLLIVAFRRRAARLRQLGTESVVARLVPPATTMTPWWRAGALGGAALCLGVAIAGPRWGSETAIVRGNGADVVLALDASLSMLATDERPNRLEKMKAEARRLLAASPDDRFGLIAFAGRSYILTPLTVDQGALTLFLDNLDPSVVGQAGSSLARAIRQGTDLLLTSHTEADRALVVMSDGEAFEPTDDVSAAANRAAENGVIVIAVGFGTPRGSTIPVVSAEGNALKRDDAGNVVVTQYSPDLLRAAAVASRGTFIAAEETDKATRVRRALSSLRTEKRRAEAGRDRRPQFQLFLIPAVLLALLDT
ncbi:MAG: VWA domain-containing protein, partial [Gemmatimonadaceae bacterium]